MRVGDSTSGKLNLPEKAEKPTARLWTPIDAHGVAAAALRNASSLKASCGPLRDMLERQLEVATGELERSRILTELGVLCRDRLSLEAEAHDYFSQALASDKSNSVAAEALLELYRARKQWHEAAGCMTSCHTAPR